ncbi:LuxR C-terminal-related transcriptional regulator [Pseudonocardia lacus]|uniref:LuxR C-terminal-related transcriptional regulator n=1 Tax=Pseudonocardia lacus TaxID=2835865 RepID=UPI001BDBDE32|nr:LuxR C-terminal-related transcriptional regulator [Pseudonocardia lacus]
MTPAPRPAHPPDASSRFRAPTYVRNVIERRRLLAVLRADSGRQLTVIQAPAGYGKTTLAVQWLRVLEDGGAAVAWLGLHRDDNDPHWFLSHLLQAVRRALPESADTLDDLRELIEQGVEDAQRYTLSAVLELIGGHPARFVLTFDDWHVIDDARVHRALVHLLDFAPPNLSLLLTSRTRPRLPLSRLRVRQQLTEVDAAALRFDLDEARAFLVDLNGLTLRGDEVARLSEGTDGWVAALQLVSLSLRDSADPAALIRDFSGRHHSIGEYLAENVLDALPGEILDFLLATSVCDRLCGELAGALAGRGDGQAMLEELERRDLFLRPLDAERTWFRYHHLFADHLRRRLERDRPERVPGLHRCASDWFSAHDLVPEAVAHALAAGDPGRATDLVESHAMALVEHSRMVSLLGLTGRLPARATHDRPRLLMAVAWANCLLQRPHDAQLALDDLHLAVPVGPEHEEMHSEADVVQACIDIYGDRTDRAEELVERSLTRSAAYRPWIVAVAANIQAFCDIHAMRYRAARDRQAWARPFHERTIGPFAGVYGRCFAGIAALAQLDLPAAEEQLQGAVALARESAGRRSHAARLAGALLGELHYERGELDEAERLLEDSRELGAESGVVDFMVASYALLARIRADRGAAAESGELLAEGTKVAERLGLTRLRAAIEAERIRQLLAAGRLREARRAAQDLPDGTGRSGGIGVVIDQIRTASLAAVRSAEGDHEGATALLEELIADLRRRGQLRAAVSATVQLSVVQERAARQMAAERSLAAALAHALPAGLCQPVLDGGPEVAAVLGRLVTRAEADTWPDGGTGAPIAPGELAALLARTGAEPAGERAAVDLTGRELAVLGMLDLGRSNQQIARSLTVTVNTVKWYLKNIYSKLGATNRAEAVSLARRGGLLS